MAHRPAMLSPIDPSELDRLVINTIKTLAIDAVQKANSGHPGTPMGLAEYAYVLWTRFLKHDPARPDWPDRDRFVLSAGHASMLLYSLLHMAGYGLTLDDLRQFRQWQSRTPGHPEHGMTPGVEVTTGPLGQGARERGRDGDRRADAGRALQCRWAHDRRSLHLRHPLRRRHDGRRAGGGGLDRRPSRPRPADLLLRRQPHHDRRLDRSHALGGRGRALRGLRLAGAADRRPRPRSDRARRSRRRGRRPSGRP